MKAVVIALICVVAGLGLLVSRQSATITSQEAQLVTIGSELSALKQEAKSVPLDVQVKCADQAHKTFVQSGFKPNDVAGYENHYNVQLKKCFIETQNTTTQGKIVWTYRNVFDAIEGKQYGAYAWHTEAEKKYWEVPPVMCQVESPQGEKQRCHSEEEFSKLVQVYMGG